MRSCTRRCRNRGEAKSSNYGVVNNQALDGRIHKCEDKGMGSQVIKRLSLKDFKSMTYRSKPSRWSSKYKVSKPERPTPLKKHESVKQQNPAESKYEYRHGVMKQWSTYVNNEGTRLVIEQCDFGSPWRCARTSESSTEYQVVKTVKRQEVEVGAASHSLYTIIA